MPDQSEWMLASGAGDWLLGTENKEILGQQQMVAITIRSFMCVS